MKIWTARPLLCGAMFVLPSLGVAAPGPITLTAPTTILSFTGSGFDATRVFSPSVVDVGGNYAMLFGGLPFGNNIQIGLATSGDGTSWAHYAATPVISNAQSPAALSFREVPRSVLYEGGTYKLWYGGNNTNLDGDPGSLMAFGYATSTDAIHWAIDPTPIRVAPFPSYILVSVTKLNGIYHAYYQNLQAGGALYQATSTDGVTFSGDTPVIAPAGYSLATTTLDSVGGQDSIFAVWNENSGANRYYGRSTDGSTFTVDAQINVSETFGIQNVLIENGTATFYGTKGVGNVNWSFGNSVIQSATAADPYAADVPEPLGLLTLGLGVLAAGTARARRRRQGSGRALG